MMPINKTNLLFIKKTISIFLGLFIINFTLWNRLIRLRLPKDLMDFNSHIMITIISTNIILSLIIIIWTLKTLLLTEKENHNKIVTYVLELIFIKKLLEILIFIRNNLIEGPRSVYKLILDKYNISHLLEVPFYKISNFLIELPITYAFILSLIHILAHALPKVIPPTVLFIEVYFFNHINFFYKTLLLYIIPLIYNTLLWVLGDLSDLNIYYATAHVHVDHHKGGAFTVTFREEIPPIEGAIDIISRKNDSKLLHWFGYIYDTYVDIKWLVYRLGLEKEKFMLYERLIISLLYLLSWSYILCYNTF